MKTILSALSLPADASEADVASAVWRLGELQREVLQLSGRRTIPEALLALRDIAAKAAQADSLCDSLQELHGRARRAEVADLLRKATTPDAWCRVRVPPGQRRWAEAYALADCQGFREYLAVAPFLRIAPGGVSAEVVPGELQSAGVVQSFDGFNPDQARDEEGKWVKDLPGYLRPVVSPPRAPARPERDRIHTQGRPKPRRPIHHFERDTPLSPWVRELPEYLQPSAYPPEWLTVPTDEEYRAESAKRAAKFVGPLTPQERLRMIVQGVNPSNDLSNCVHIVNSVIDALEGKPVTPAAHGKGGTSAQIARRYQTHFELVPLAQFQTAFERVRAWGEGTVGILSMILPNGIHHAVVIANIGGRVYILEGQDWGGDQGRGVFDNVQDVVDRYRQEGEDPPHLELAILPRRFEFQANPPDP